MVATVPPRIAEAQRLSTELERALAERKSLALALGRSRRAGQASTVSTATLRAATERVDALLAALERLLPPADRPN